MFVSDKACHLETLWLFAAILSHLHSSRSALDLLNIQGSFTGNPGTTLRLCFLLSLQKPEMPYRKEPYAKFRRQELFR